MSKIMCIFGLSVAVLLLLVFALDLAIKLPFSRASMLMDIGGVLGALGLGIISFTTLREQG